MVRKVIAILFATLITVAAICGTVSAVDYTAYDGNISTTQLTYFKDLLPSIKLNENYVLSRTGQYEYIMVVGDSLTYDNGIFLLNDPGRIYKLDTSSSNYNSYYTYSFSNIDSFYLDSENKVVYSDLGNFPELEERGQKYEILQTVTIVVIGLCIVIRSIFNATDRKRRDG